MDRNNTPLYTIAKSMIRQKLIGTGVALVTPFDEQLRVDWKGLEKLLRLTVKAGVSYFVANGTTGEAATTTADEKREILHFIRACDIKKIPLVYGISGNNTAEVLKELANTDFRGIDVILTVSPYYNRPSQEGIYRHYKAIADASPVPIMLYNVPSRTGSNIEARTTLRLSKHKNIVGIKEVSGDLIQCITIAQGKPHDFFLISGDDILTVPMMAVGAIGVISVLANGLPEKVCQMVNAALMNDYTKARAQQWELLRLNELMAQGGNPTTIKHILHLLKVCHPYVRLPLTTLSARLIEKIHIAVKGAISR